MILVCCVAVVAVCLSSFFPPSSSPDNDNDNENDNDNDNDNDDHSY